MKSKFIQSDSKPLVTEKVFHSRNRKIEEN